MAKITLQIPDDQVEDYLDVFALVIHGTTATGKTTVIALDDIGAYYQEQAAATVAQHRAAEVTSIFQAAQSDPETGSDIDKIVKRAKEIKAERDKDRKKAAK